MLIRASIFVAIAIAFLSHSAQADVFILDSSNSQMTFDGFVRVAVGPSFVDLPITEQSAGSLTSTLGGSFWGDPGSSSLLDGGTIIQLLDIRADVLSPESVDIGDVLIAGTDRTAFTVNATTLRLVTQSGAVAYAVDSTSPLFSTSGTYDLTGTQLTISNVTFAGPQVDFDASFSGILPTSSSQAFVYANFTGHVRGFSGVPEPGGGLVLLISSLCIGMRRRKRIDVRAGKRAEK